MKCDDPLWYKDAIVYELHVKAFCDSDRDGIGDFLGLTEKLDYLVDLGVTISTFSTSRANPPGAWTSAVPSTLL